MIKLNPLHPLMAAFMGLSFTHPAFTGRRGGSVTWKAPATLKHQRLSPKPKYKRGKRGEYQLARSLKKKGAAHG